MEFLCLEYFFISILQSGGNDSSTAIAVFLKDFMCVCVCVFGLGRKMVRAGMKEEVETICFL